MLWKHNIWGWQLTTKVLNNLTFFKKLKFFIWLVNIYPLPRLQLFYFSARLWWTDKYLILSGVSQSPVLPILIGPSCRTSLWHFSSWGGREADRLLVCRHTPHCCSPVAFVQFATACYRAHFRHVTKKQVGDGTRRRLKAYRTQTQIPHMCEHSQLHDEVEVGFTLKYLLQRNNVGVFNPVKMKKKKQRFS